MKLRALLVSVACLSAVAAQGEVERPNVVFILADDLGWRDLGCYGSDYYETPHIDALAKRGLRFTQAYAASPLCSPTRASIMTGLYPARTGITYVDCHLPQVVMEKRLQKAAPSNQRHLLAQSVSRLDTNYFSLGQAFKRAGYVTGHFGKWHLGPEPFSPLEHGFDVDVPHTPAPGPLLHGFFYPFPVWKGHGKPGDNLEDLLASEAVKFIEQNKGKPFFLNYWSFQVHSPWQAKSGQIAKYKPKVRPDFLQRNPVYAGMVETMDEAVGRIVSALENAGVLERTVIIFTSDNGPFVASHSPPLMPEEFQKVPVTSALPLRAGKQSVYEGGIRVPLIVVWPGVTRANSVTDALALSTDFYPTFVDLLQWPLGNKFNGVSLRRILEGKGTVRDEIFCHFPHSQDTRRYEQMVLPTPAGPACTLRKGDWKLVRYFADGQYGTDRFELYNLKEDIGEIRNMARSHPEKLQELQSRLLWYLKETDAVIPERNPAYRDRKETSK